MRLGWRRFLLLAPDILLGWDLDDVLEGAAFEAEEEEKTVMLRFQEQLDAPLVYPPLRSIDDGETPPERRARQGWDKRKNRTRGVRARTKKETTPRMRRLCMREDCPVELPWTALPQICDLHAKELAQKRSRRFVQW